MSRAGSNYLREDKAIVLAFEGFRVFEIIPEHDIALCAYVRHGHHPCHESCKDDSVICEISIRDISSPEVIGDGSFWRLSVRVKLDYATDHERRAAFALFERCADVDMV